MARTLFSNVSSGTGLPEASINFQRPVTPIVNLFLEKCSVFLVYFIYFMFNKKLQLFQKAWNEALQAFCMRRPVKLKDQNKAKHKKYKT